MKSDRVFVLESPIDVMSHATLSKMNGLDPAKDHRISLGCLSDAALARYLKWHPEIKRIVFALDNDMDGKGPDGAPRNHGQEAAHRYSEKYAKQGYDTYVQTPAAKDFNEVLIAIRRAEAAERPPPHAQEQEGEDEIVAAWDRANAAPFEDVSRFRILSEYNNVVLAARDDTEKGYGHPFEFATWEYSPNRTGLNQGHYKNDYEAAKQDFAVRSGLVDRHKLFDETEMKLIHQGLVHLGANFPDLTVEQNTLLGKVVEKIEMLVPEIQEREELEHNNLVPDDGLEV